MVGLGCGGEKVVGTFTLYWATKASLDQPWKVHAQESLEFFL